MPRILASQVVEFVDRSFPKLKETGDLESLDPGSYQTLAILAEMVNSIEEQVFGNLNASDYTDLVVATSYIKATVSRWQFPPTPGHGNHSVSKYLPLNNRHPVVVIRSILQALPDEPVLALSAKLGFLADPALEESIGIDIGSAEAGFADGRFKNACVMAGAAIEALLLWAVQRKPTEHTAAYSRANARRQQCGAHDLKKLDPDPRCWGLEQYVEVARELPALSVATASAAILAKDFRNLIHPGLAERKKASATRGSAAQAIAALQLTIEDLERLVKEGSL